jgi:hypothetical protein
MRVSRDLIIGVEDVMVTAGGEPTLRQDLDTYATGLMNCGRRWKPFRRCYRWKAGTGEA